MKQQKMRRGFVSLAGVATIALALFSSALMAQSTGAGTITGTLTDPTGSAVPDAAVIVRNTSTAATLSLATNAAGIYVAPFLPPGLYDITANKAGFSKIVRTGLTLQVGQTLTVDFALALKTITETVTVAGDASLVDTQKTDVSQVVSQSQKEFLPNAGRRWENFALLTPNVTTDGGTGLVSYRGISGLYNQSAVDGTSNTQAFFAETKGRTTLSYVYSTDSLQEFQVASSNYSAELGQAAGGVVNAVTKSGTNAMHGDVFYFLRYPSLNALDPIQKSKGVFTQPVHQQQQFGGSLGGPIQKDKLFYFFTYDGSRRVVPIVYTSTSFNGPQPCPTAVSASQCAAANSFIAGQLGAFPRTFNQDVGFGKLDYQINPANHLSASFDLLNYHSPNAYRTNNTQNNEAVSANGTAVTRERIFVANWDSTLRPTVINNFRFQWSVDLEKISENGTAPSVTIQNFMNYGMPNALPRPAFPNEHRLQFADVLSANYGKHTIKAGVDVSAIHEVLINLFSGGGVYAYNGAAAFQNWAADVMGINLGDGFTGRHYSTFLQVTDPVTGVGKDDFYDQDFAAFVEDSWKVRSNLTLNLGVRYDLTLIPQPPQPNLLTPLTALYTSTINIDKNNFAPRVGVAWEISKGTVLRAGYGIFYAKTTNSTYYATRVENGVIQQSFNCNPTLCPGLKFPNVIFTPPGGTPQAPFAGALTPQIVPFIPPAGTQTTRAQDPSWVSPLVHEGEVTLERVLPGNMSISAGYVLSRALHLPVFVDSNIAPATTTRSYDVLNSAAGTVSTFTVPFYTTRLNPKTGPILTGYSDVNSWYNSFVLTFRKRMERGVEFVGNYTLSKAVDGGQVGGQFGTFNGTDSPIDPYNRKLEYGLSDLDQRQRFVGNLIWVPQFTRKLSSKPVRMIVDGFSFSTIVTVATGQPVTGVIGTSNFPGGIAGGPTGGTVNNSGSAFGGRLPNIPRNADLGPGVGNVDVRVARDFKITERLRLSLAGEAFNVFNFTNFFTVNTQSYNFAAAGAAGCVGHANGCLVPVASYLTPTASNNGLYGARQLQISGRIIF